MPLALNKKRHYKKFPIFLSKSSESTLCYVYSGCHYKGMRKKHCSLTIYKIEKWNLDAWLFITTSENPLQFMTEPYLKMLNLLWSS